MSQGNINESQVGLSALKPRASSHRAKAIRPQDLVKLTEGSSDKNASDSKQPSDLIKAKKPLESFDSIRDLHKSMLRLIDTMFDLLQAHVYEENSANPDAKVQFHIQRPSLEKQPNKSWLNTTPEQPVFTGKIYSYDWSLILKGTSEIVFCYVIPSDRVISFNSDPEIYKPYLTINSFRQGASFGWQIEGQTITGEHLVQVTDKLFDKLIKSMKSQQWNESTFCLPSLGVGLELTDEEDLQAQLDMKARHNPEQILMELMKAAQEAAPPIDEFKFSKKENNQDKAIAITPDIPNGNQIAVSTSGQTFEQTLNLLLNLLNQKLEQLVGEGAQALNDHDFRAAQTVLTLTHELDEFKKKTNEIINALENRNK